MENVRGRKAALAQTARHSNKWLYVFGEMRDRAIRFAVSHRRTIWTTRRIHENGRAARQRHAIIGPCRSVPLHAAALGFAKTRLIKKFPDSLEAFGAHGERADSRDR